MIKNHRFKLLAVAAAFVLAACSQTSQNAKVVQGTCLAAAIALEQVTDNIENVSTEHIVRIQTVNDTIIHPICAQQEQPQWEELVLGRLDQAIKVIAGVEHE